MYWAICVGIGEVSLYINRCVDKSFKEHERAQWRNGKATVSQKWHMVERFNVQYSIVLLWRISPSDATHDAIKVNVIA
jgi:hypothetical protein